MRNPSVVIFFEIREGGSFFLENSSSLSARTRQKERAFSCIESSAMIGETKEIERRNRSVLVGMGSLKDSCVVGEDDIRKGLWNQQISLSWLHERWKFDLCKMKRALIS